MKLVKRFPASLVLLLTILPKIAWGQEEGIDDEFAFLEEAMTDDSNNLILVLIDGRETLIELSGFPIGAFAQARTASDYGGEMLVRVMAFYLRGSF